MTPLIKINSKHNPLLIYAFVILLGICAGLTHNSFAHILGQTISDIFLKIFKCISIPIIALSLIVTLSNNALNKMNVIIKRTFIYTITTTLIAASISCLLYLIIKPQNVNHALIKTVTLENNSHSYWHYLTLLIPDNLFSPFVENQVMSVLLISVMISLGIRSMPDNESKKILILFFKGLHALFLNLTKWILVLLPIGLFGFITTTVVQLHEGVNVTGVLQYLAVIVIANLIQGLIILPAWLTLNRISAFDMLRKMMPALSFAFFSKSSAGTLPITINTIEENLKVDPKISRFVLPLCTSINMNGCAAFIFATVIFLMQNHGIEISFLTMGIWILIASIAAIGNAGVPMGCFFLSASLLAGMDVPITLLGIILPFYNVIDMIETTLNVWSDVCVTKIVSQYALDEEVNISREFLQARL